MRHLCPDRAGPWQSDPGQAQVFRKGAERESCRGEERKRDKKEETQLFGHHESSGGIKHIFQYFFVSILYLVEH